jgi:hypothetical protein
VEQQFLLELMAAEAIEALREQLAWVAEEEG